MSTQEQDLLRVLTDPANTVDSVHATAPAPTTPIDRHLNGFARFVGLLGAVAGLMFGLDIGVIAGAEQFIQRDFGISDTLLEYVVSWMMLGAAAGALGSIWISARLGRKRSLLLGALIFVLASILCGVAWSVDVLLIGRLILGFSIGILSSIAPVYLVEIAPKHIRGSMVSTYQLMMTSGILLAFLSDLAFSYSANWHWMLGIIGVPGAVFFLGALALPESPRWLMTRGRDDEAVRVLMKLRHKPAAVESERREIAAQLQNTKRGWRLFFENRNVRRAVGLGVLLQIVQQFTGINIVMYYAPRIFQSMGYRTEAQLWFTAAVGLVNVLATVIAIRFVDRWGRKPILYSGFATMALGLGVVGTMMHIGMHTESTQLLAVVMLLVFIVGFACSAGPVIWILCSEIQPIQGREFGMSLATMSNWISNFVIDGTFLTVLHHFGSAPTFWLYSGLNVLFLFIVFLLVPETKNVTLEFIERNLMAGRPLREIGQ